MYRPDQGQIFVYGKEVKIDSSAAAIKLGIGMVHQHFMLVPSLTVAENIVLGREPTKRRCLLDVGRIENHIKALSDRYKLGVDPKTVTHDLPVGLQQRVEILKALFRGAEILILDEPTSGADIHSKTEFNTLLSNLNRDRGIAVILSSHDIGTVTRLASKVVCINRSLFFCGFKSDFTDDVLAKTCDYQVKVIDHVHA
jgi:simple sugar transport system ATP-binding protein